MTEPAGPVLPRALRAALPLYAGLAVTYGAAFAFKALLVQKVLAGPAEMLVLEQYDRFAQGLVAVTLLGVPAGVLRMGSERPARLGAILNAAVLIYGAVFAVAVAALYLVPGAAELVTGRHPNPLTRAFVSRAAALG